MLSAHNANRRYFRDAYRTGEHGWAVKEPDPFVLDVLSELVRQRPGGALLDIGCGEGRHAIAAARAGFRVFGVDLEPLALLRARRFAGASGVGAIPFAVANVLSLPFADARFEVILDYGCLHHQRRADWSAYKAGLLRVLKHDGILVLSVFSPRFHLFRGRRRNWHIANGAYRRCFTREDIDGLFSADFAVTRLLEETGERAGFWHAQMRRR